ncbi:hypothetical protein Tco_0893808 [Tanacetum coccineum]|uniref:Uncharacterized protein n=1 Tax=Tanacetum coccineum TaxID=301880 RepID=A0ABQ5C9X2_9ASTR
MNSNGCIMKKSMWMTKELYGESSTLDWTDAEAYDEAVQGQNTGTSNRQLLLLPYRMLLLMSTTASANNKFFLLFLTLSFSIQQSTPIPTLTKTKAKTSTTVVPDFETLNALHQRMANLEKDVKELKDVDNSTKVISKIKSEVLNAVKEYLGSSLDDALYIRQQYAPQKSIEDIREIKMEHARKQQVPKETITSSDTTTLEKFDQKTTLFLCNNDIRQKILKHRALNHALIESILKDKDAMEEGVAKKLKKRKPDDADKDEDPSAGPD